MIRRNTILLSFFISILVFSVANISSMPQQNLSTTPTTYAGSDGYENDNSFTNASSISLGISQSRTLGLYDKDYIQFTPAPGLPLYQVTVNANVSYVTGKVYDLNQTYLYSMEFDSYQYITQKVIFNGPVYIVMSYFADLTSYTITVSNTTISDTNEPDNSLLTATPIVANSTSSVQAIPLGDTDTYVFQNGPIESVVSVSTLADMTQPGYDTTLAILDSLGNQVYYNDDFNGTLLSGMSFFAPMSSTFYFQVSHYTYEFSTSGNYINTYQLRVRTHTFHPDVYEPQDLTTGVTISKDQILRRNIRDNSDHDLFNINATANSTMTLNVTVKVDDYLYVDLYDPSMNVTQTFNVHSWNSYLQFTAGVSGTYTLDMYSDHFMRYSVNYIGIISPDIAEPNDQKANAYQLFDRNYSFSFSTIGDVDYYAFNVTQPSTYIVQVSTLMPHTYLNYSLFDIYDNVIQNDNNLWLAYSGPLFLSMNSGIYYLALQSGSHSSNDMFNYTLSIQAVPNDNNNDFNHATNFVANSTINGMILPNDDDYYSFTLNQTSLVTITTAIPTGDYYLPDMELYNSSYFNIASSYNDNGSSVMSTVLDAGTYFVRVFSYYGSFTPYNVTLNAVASNIPTTTTSNPTTTDTSTSTTTSSSSTTTSTRDSTKSTDGGNSTETPSITLPGFQISLAFISISFMIMIDRKRRK